MTKIFYKYSHHLFFLILLLTSFFVKAQEKKSISDIEKIYLHTDRSTYFMGEDLWYKAYDLRAYNNLLFDKSNILYVELISPDSKIMARNKTNLVKGLGHGDFQLQDSLDIKPGKYQLRAYTNWDRNFGEDFIFNKEIEIMDVFEKKTQNNNTTKMKIESKPKNKISKIQNTFTIDFFPEGGSFLENVSSVVGYKAVDINGKPIDVKGEVYNSDNELITNFESEHDGMGSFKIIPIEGKKYYTKIKTSTGLEQRKELPTALNQGYLLSFKILKEKNVICISTNQATLAQNPNELLKLDCKSRGISYLNTAITLIESKFSVELPYDKTPEGISQITLFDSTNKPQSERLIYIEKEHDLVVELAADKAIYKPNEKVRLNVSSKSENGFAKSASFSMSVTDTNGVETEGYGTTISSYFLMESDIRGKVHNPGYYFTATNPKRLEHLDNLLLTQGWRDFVWKTIPKSNNTVDYKLEKGITISGRVKQVFVNKPLINTYLALGLVSKKNQNFFNTTSDSLGYFKFDNIMFSGKTNMFLNNINKKGKLRGQIVLDSIELNPIPVKIKNENLFLLETTNSLAENVSKKYIAFGVKPENILDEVKVKSQKQKTNPLKVIPDYSFKVNKIEANKYFNFIDYLEQELKGIVNVEYDAIVGKNAKKWPFAIVIDGYQAVSGDQLLWVSADYALSVDVAKGLHVKAVYGKSTVVSIITKSKTGQAPIKVPLHSVKQEIEGFYTPRIFYSPNPEKPDVKLDKIADVRNTLYWNPYIHPDKTGNAIVSFYNTKAETKVKVALEGVTGSGIPVVKSAYYEIKKE